MYNKGADQLRSYLYGPLMNTDIGLYHQKIFSCVESSVCIMMQTFAILLKIQICVLSIMFGIKLFEMKSRFRNGHFCFRYFRF